jgi:2-haloacid dehalogenase
MVLTEKRVLTFDCYGTLIDWESGIVEALYKIFPTDIAEDTLLSIFASHETTIQSQNPTWLYPQVLAQASILIGDQVGISVSEDLANNFSKSIASWPPFSDTRSALMQLQKRFKLVIVSNIDNDSIIKSAALMGISFDHIYTAKDIGAYKPDHKVFYHVFDKLQHMGFQKSEILHVAQSLYHDHMPAYELGLDRVWIDRRYLKDGEGATPSVDPKYIPQLRFIGLQEFADFCG